MKRIIGILLCLTIAIGCVGASMLSASAAAYDETSYTLTGNQRADIVGIALTQVGYRESGDNVQKYGPTAPWCTYFVKWCAEKAGIPSSIFLNFGDCSSGISAYQNAGLWQGASYTPNPGDLIFFVWGHVGIVNYVDASGGIHIIDGNFSDKVNDRTITSGGGYWYGKSSIVGYGTPAYTTADHSSDTVQPEEPAGEEVDAYYRVVTETDPLNLRSSYSTGAAIVGSIPKGAIFHVSRMITNGGYTWGLTNYLTQEAWCALNYAELVEPDEPEEPEEPATPTTSVSLNRTSAILMPGDTLQLTAVVSPESAEPLAWSVTDQSVATCAEGGITAISAGEATVTATLPTGESAICKLTVLASAEQVGDVDGDGKVSVSDVVMLRSIILGSIHISDAAKAVADIDGDGKLVVSDVIAARRLILT